MLVLKHIMAKAIEITYVEVNSHLVDVSKFPLSDNVILPCRSNISTGLARFSSPEHSFATPNKPG